MFKEERQVLLIINDPEVCKNVENSIREKFKFEVETSTWKKDALSMIEASPWQYDVVVIYDDLTKKSWGIEILKEIKEIYSEIEMVIIFNSEKKDDYNAWCEGAFNCFYPPISYEGIAYAVKFAREHTQFRRERRILEKLQGLSIAISSATELPEIQNLACQAAVICTALIGSIELFKADLGCILLNDEGYLRISESYGFPQNFDYGAKIKVGESLIGETAKNGNSHAIADLPSNDSYIPFLTEGKSALIIPLKIKERLIGVIYLESKLRDYFRAEDELFQILSAEAAVAINRAQLLEEKEKTREALFKSTNAVAAGQIATGFIHDVKNSLNTIAMTIGNIGKRIQKEPDIDIRSKQDYIEKINCIETEILRSCELSRQFQRFGQRLATEKVDTYLNDVVRNAVELLNSILKRQIIKLDLKLDQALDNYEIISGKELGGIPIYIDKGQIEQVMINLILNAIEASNPRSRLVVETKLNESTSEIRVTDYGKGIAYINLPEIFKPFFTTKPDGVGLGLYICKLIVEENHQGKISVNSKPDKGTTFTVHLPRISNQKRS